MQRDEFESKVLELWVKSRIPLTHSNLQYFSGVPSDTLSSWIGELLNSGTLEVQVDDLEQDDLEQVVYAVPRAARSVDGPSTCEAYERKRALINEAKRRILARRAGKPDPAIAEKSRAERSLGLETTRRQHSEKPHDHDDDERGDDERDDDDDEPGLIGMVGKAALLASTTALVTLDKPLSMLDKPRGKGDKSLVASAALSLLGPVGWLYAGSFREAVPATLAFAAGYYILPSFLLAPFMLVGALASSVVGLGYAWQFNRKKERTPLLLSKKAKKKKNG